MTSIETAAEEVFGAISGGTQIAAFSRRPSRMLEPEEAYRVTARLRALRLEAGDRPVGRKIGFTNRLIWERYGVGAPMWGDVYASTLTRVDGRASASLAGLVEPRIEPEIVLGLAAAPEAGMDDAALARCVGWIAHGCEIVQSIYPGWQFSWADSILAGGLHARLFVGPAVEVPGEDAPRVLAGLTEVAVTLEKDGTPVESGVGANALDGPLSALRHLVELLAADPGNPKLTAGEVVTTGTLTDAWPVAPGEVWSTKVAGAGLSGLTLAFTA